jgi:hypothetical protein
VVEVPDVRAIRRKLHLSRRNSPKNIASLSTLRN